MKKIIITAVCLGVSTLSANFLNSIVEDVVNTTTKSTEKKVERKTGNNLSVHSSASELGKRRVPPTNSKAKKSTTLIELGTPDKSLIELTQCTNLKLSNIIVGNNGNYTFKKGFNKEKRSGFINRIKGKVSNKCVLPSLKPMKIVYMEVDTKKFKAMGSSNDWSMQCVKSNNLNDGAVNDSEPKGEYPYKVNYLAGKDVLLHCGNSENIKECAKGSNSSRSGAWDKKLKSRNKTMLSVLANKSSLAAKTGEKLYCQYYNSKTEKSLFAFEYLRVK